MITSKKVTIHTSVDWNDVISYMVVFQHTVSIKLWWNSPKALRRSINIMVTECCLQLALFIMCNMLAICSKGPLKPGVNPFCIEVSIYLLLCENSNSISYQLCKILQHNWFQRYRSKVWRVRFIALFINQDGSCSLAWLRYWF